MKLKDRAGKEITFNEFMVRWKEGIKNVPPIQQTAASLWGGGIVLIGIVWGIIFSLYMAQYWLSLILVGSFVLSAIGLYGNWQKYLALKKIDDSMRMIDNMDEKEEIDI